ncbi:hypothetical protein [Xanthomonas oryzae]|uniref:hypothetical protein n=1 Tax=Xanthomonas oryzae TaxID=347 RepID=UPI001E605567|nr:hypothetical protein [Xanthomonas oryzae]
MPIYIPATFRRNKSVEQFLGKSPIDARYIRHTELRPRHGAVEVWVCDVEDVGYENFADLYALSSTDPDELDVSAAVFPDAASAVSYASEFLAADPDRWTNLGIAESDYLDHLRAGRPAHWPLQPCRQATGIANEST